MNCVTASSPTTGLRTIHLLRSILFRALPWHAIPVDTTLCLHPHFNLKNSHKLSFGMSTTTLLRLRGMFNIAAEIPTGFQVACRTSRWRSLIYLLSYRWWSTVILQKYLKPFSPTSSRALARMTVKARLLFSLIILYALTTAPLGFLFLPFHPAIQWLWIT